MTNHDENHKTFENINYIKIINFLKIFVRLFVESTFEKTLYEKLHYFGLKMNTFLSRNKIPLKYKVEILKLKFKFLFKIKKNEET